MKPEATITTSVEDFYEKFLIAKNNHKEQFFDGSAGIVTCAGGVRLFTNVYVLIRILRDTLKCKLPIELWHFGGEEISPSMRKILLDLDVELVDATQQYTIDGSKMSDGWQLKSFAIFHSRFSQVLFLDADQVPVSNPEQLFDWPEYKRTGAVFWPDIVDIRSDNQMWSLLRLAGKDTWSFESGQLLVDKRRHLTALAVANFLNQEADTVYQYIYGDKDTFLFAWLATESKFSLIPHRPFTDDRFLVQRDFSGAPLFQHRTGSKFCYGAAPEDIAGLQLVDLCRQYLEELESLWNGRLYFAPDRSIAARLEEERMAALGQLELNFVGDHQIVIELLPNNEIGRGRSIERQNWFIQETKAGFELVIVQGDRASIKLEKCRNGIWKGTQSSMVRSQTLLYEPIDLQEKILPVPGLNLLGQLISASGINSRTEDHQESVVRDLEATLRFLLRCEPNLKTSLAEWVERPGPVGSIASRLLKSSNGHEDSSPDKNVDVLGSGYSRPDRLNL